MNMYNGFDISDKIYTISEKREMAVRYLNQQYLGRGGIFAIKATGRYLSVFATRDDRLLPRGVNGFDIQLHIVETGAFENKSTTMTQKTNET